MEDRKQSVTVKWKRILMASALTASVVLALPVWTFGQAEAAPTEKLDLEKPCSLKIERSPEHAKQGKVQVDLYKVAEAEKTVGYDAYRLTIPKNSPYYDLLAGDLKKYQDENSKASSSDGANADYRALAQKAANVVFSRTEKDGTEEEIWTKNPAVSKTATLDLSGGLNALEGLGSGMYLVVAHGADLSAEQYTTTRKNEAGVDQIVTMAYSDDSGYVYTYLPELIALPSRGAARTGSFNTADTDPWSYTVTATLKSEEESRYASLQIGKTFMVPGDAVIIGGNSCVFQVEAVQDGVTVYSGVAEIPYAGRATGSVKISNAIPVGAEIRVTEVYSGASFTVSGDSQKTIPSAEPDEEGVIKNRVFFTNTGDGVSTGGDIVTNTFTHGEDGWTWNDPRPAPAQQ